MPSKFFLLNSSYNEDAAVGRKMYADLHTNAGNSYIAYSLTRLFGLTLANTVVNNSMFSGKGITEEEVERAADSCHIFLNIQDHLRADLDDSDFAFATGELKKLERLSSPLIVFSLSANSPGGFDPDLHLKLSAEKLRFFAALFDRAQSIGVRGAYTAEIAQKLGAKNIEVTGCPTYFETGAGRTVRETLPAEGAESIGVTGDLRLVEQEENCRYLLQGDTDWAPVQLLYGESDVRLPDWTIADRQWLRHPLYDAVWRAAAGQHVRFFTDHEVWKAYIAENCAVVAGSRLHGSILALNAGVPALVTNTDARARESCDFLGIPQTTDPLPPTSTPADILARCDIGGLNARYPVVFRNFSRWATAQGLSVKDEPGAGIRPPSVELLPLSTTASRITAMLMDHRGEVYGEMTRELERAQGERDRAKAEAYDEAQRSRQVLDKVRLLTRTLHELGAMRDG